MRASLRTSVLLAATAAVALASGSSAVGAERATPAAASSSSTSSASPTSSSAAPAPATAEPPASEPAPNEPSTSSSSSSSSSSSDEEAEEPAATKTHELHGSQVASSEWLPITIGGGVGLVLGVVIGNAVDPSQPVVWGPIAGGVLGALSGGAGGAWILRQARGEDTRLAATLTGLGLGGSIGASVYAHVDSTIGKVAALVLFPAAGALAGHRLAFVLGGDGKERRPVMAIAPTAVPIFGEGRTGLLLGVNGVLF